MIRSTLRTQMQEGQSALLPNAIHEPPRHISKGFPQTGGTTRVKLRFVDVERPKELLYTGCPVEWHNRDNAKVAIFENDRQITQGDLSKLQVEILPVRADFFTERGQADFTKEEFNKHLYTYKGKESVLTTVNLTNGEASIGSFIFTESSYRKKLRLTARVKRQDLTVRVQEAITDPFVFKERRSKFNEKSYPPSKEEAVHRLERISPKGKHCHDLADKNITTVKHLMRHYHRSKSGLQKLRDMKKDDWSTLIKHATTSDPGIEIYSYRVAEENTELLFNDFYDLIGMMVDGLYVPVKNLDHFRQLKAKNWKMSAYKSFDERENSGGLTPDYFMSNGRPVREEHLKNEAGPSTQVRTAWPYPNGMAAQQEFAPLFSHHTYEQIAHQGLGQQGPMPQNGTPYCHLTQENTLNSQGPLSAQPNIRSYNFPPVPQDDLITCASLTGQQNGYLNSWTTDAPGASYPEADGVSQGTSSLNRVDDDIFSGLLDELLAEEEADGADQDIIPANNAEQPDPDNQFHGYEHNDGNW
ncbi:unnamed protein product [Alopecurus aequalis]